MDCLRVRALQNGSEHGAPIHFGPRADDFGLLEQLPEFAHGLPRERLEPNVGEDDHRLPGICMGPEILLGYPRKSRWRFMATTFWWVVGPDMVKKHPSSVANFAYPLLVVVARF